MKYLYLVVLVFMFAGCFEKEPAVVDAKPIVKEVLTIQEPCVVEKIVPIEVEELVCPKVHPCAPCAKIKACKPITIYKEYKKIVLGELEDVYLPVHKLSYKARIDTGAQTSSIDAQNIVAFERDGKDWVRFEIGSGDNKVQIKMPIVKTIKIKRHETKAQDRYVVNMRINISSLSNYIEVSLTDRSQYKFPVLIGRNYLHGSALVDVNLEYTRPPNKDN